MEEDVTAGEVMTLEGLLNKYDYTSIHITVEPRRNSNIDLKTLFDTKNYCKNNISNLNDQILYILLSGMKVEFIIEGIKNTGENKLFYYTMPNCKELIKKSDN